MTLWWYDDEWNIHWDAASDSVAAFRLAVDVAARLQRAQRVAWRANAPWELPARVAETAPEIAAAAMADLWRREGQVEGALNANGAEYRISAITEGEGGQLSLQCSGGVFGGRYDDLVAMLQPYAVERQIRVFAPLQELTFGG